MISVTINGKKIATLEGETILQSARRAGIAIPALCAEGRLEPFDSCGVCVVEVEGIGIVKSCSTPVRDGMVITTHSKAAEDVRRTALELLLSNHWGDCIAPCQRACPVHTDCQGYVSLAANGLSLEALQLLYEKLPFPASFGRICPAPCEDACRREIADEPIQIKYMKRFLGDKEFNYTPSVAADTGKRVAIVGGGPAGLSAAYFLRRNGHATVVFDAMPKMGGMLRYGIPDYRLPQEVLDRELTILERMGIEFQNNVCLGKDLSLEQLERDFNAIFLALGAWHARSLSIPGEGHEAVYQGIDFLLRINQGERMPLPGKVAVIGGGNTAMDAARSARRLGAEVAVLYRRSREEMPARPQEVKEAEEEGVEFHLLTQPVEFVANGDALSGIKCIKMELGKPDASGRARPAPIDGSEFMVLAEVAILAVGQAPDTACLAEWPVNMDRQGRIVVDEATGQTSREKIFAGGDVVTGPSIAVEAVGAAHRVALAIERYLHGEEVNPPFAYIHEKVDVTRADIEDVAEAPRVPTKVRQPATRIHDFAEYETDLTDEQAQLAGQRCLGCGCAAFDSCALRDYSAEVHAVQETHTGELSRELPDKRHPFIIRELGKCIACGRCVRVCSEVCGIHAIDFVGRGISVKVQAPFDRPWQESTCVSCGACVDTCPTGALVDKTTLEKQVPIKLEATRTVCSLCSLGCEIDVQSLNGHYMKTVPGKEDGILCAKGRYGWHTLLSQPRLTRPLVRTEDGVAEVSWEEAFAHIKEKLPRNENETAVICAGHLTNEEGYLISRLAREGLRTNLLLLEPFNNNAGATLPADAVASTDEIAVAELIIVVGPRSTYERFVLDLKIRAAQRSGATVVSLQGDLPDADIAIEDIPAKQILESLAGKAGGREDNRVAPIRERIAVAQYPLVAVEERATEPHTIQAIATLAEKNPAFRVLHLRALPNMNGLMKWGFSLGSKTSLNQVRACFIFGANLAEDPTLAKRLRELDLVVAVAPTRNETTSCANIVLPMCFPIENQGHLINNDNKTEKLRAAVESPIPKQNWQILVELASVLERDWSYSNLETVTQEIKTARTSPYGDKQIGASYSCCGAGSLAVEIETGLSRTGL